MIQKAFSIIEILFVIAVISIILIVALPKLNTIFNSAHKTQIKSTITLIREGIVKEKNKLLLANSLETLNTLDDGDEFLFTKVLATPIKESANTEANSWVRISSNNYKVYLDETTTVEFIYDPITYTFDCDFNEPLCKELTH